MTAKRNVQEIKPNLFALPHSFIILAAGAGNRTRSFGVKSLIKLPNNESIIDRQIRIIKESFQIPNIVVVSGFESDRLMNKLPLDVCKVENEKYEEESITRSISMGLRAAITDRIFLIYGDIVFSENVFKHHQAQSYIFIDKSGLMDTSSVGCTIHDNKAELLLFDLSNKWGQIGYFSGRELRLLKSIVWNKDNHKLFGFELINKIIESDGKMDCVGSTDTKFFDIDLIKDIEKFNKL